jgi:hypothetical protein
VADKIIWQILTGIEAENQLVGLYSHCLEEQCGLDTGSKLAMDRNEQDCIPYAYLKTNFH